jgi:hypothetical protein
LTASSQFQSPYDWRFPQQGERVFPGNSSMKAEPVSTPIAGEGNLLNEIYTQLKEIRNPPQKLFFP